MPIAAIGTLVSLALVGGGVDMSRSYMVQSRLLAACDAGVLAGRKAVSTAGFDTAVSTTANNYFYANFNQQDQGATNTSFVPTSTNNGNTINGTATTRLDTVIMKVFGFTKFDLSVNCTATMGVGNSDIVMVLDTTGSMEEWIDGEAKIVSLRKAMNNFYDTVATATAGSNARIRYGFVPYSSSVNVGKLLYTENPAYLVDYYDIQSRRPVYKQIATRDPDLYGPEYNPDPKTGSSNITSDGGAYYSSTLYSKSGCNNAKPADDTVWSPSGSPSISTSAPYIDEHARKVVRTTTAQTQTQKAYLCAVDNNASGNKTYRIKVYNEYRTVYTYEYSVRDPIYVDTIDGPFDHYLYIKIKYDVRDYKAFKQVSTVTGSGGANVLSTWKGCIEERSTVSEPTFAFSTSDGITPSGALDLNIDKIPDSDDATKWAPMWPEVAYQRGDGSFTPVAGSEYASGRRASSYCPYQSQLLKTMDNKAFEDYATALRAEGSTYHDLGLIWGARLSSPDGIFAKTVNEKPNNAGAVSRHLIFMTDGELAPNNDIQSSYGIEFHDKRVTEDGSSSLTSRHRSRYLAVCEAVKAKGIRLWVIAFGTSLTTDMEDCASDDSAFPASNATELNKAFQEIAKQVGELRIMQ